MTGVLVVDDSRFVRTVVGDALTEHGFEVATASDGREAVDLVRATGPDVVTMDVAMPGMDGIEATERIMAERPTPVVMLAATDDADALLGALASGAVDFVHKAGDETPVAAVEEELVRTVEAVADAPTETLVHGATGAPDGTDTDDRPTPGADTTSTTDFDSGAVPSDSVANATANIADTLDAAGPSGDHEASAGATATVVVGASTGGPSVVETLLGELPTGIGARVLVVQHMPEAFTGRLADRLDRVSDYDVSEAEPRARVGPDEAVLARGDRHLTVDRAGERSLRVRLVDDPPVHNVRPAVDVTMESAAAVHDPRDPLVGVVLTGMGRDGAEGVAAVADADGTTVTQDRHSSPVAGMPRAAVETGAVDRVVSAAALPAAVREAVRTQRRDRQREEAHA